jgi:hypothetical protein
MAQHMRNRCTWLNMFVTFNALPAWADTKCARLPGPGTMGDFKDKLKHGLGFELILHWKGPVANTLTWVVRPTFCIALNTLT